VERELLPMAKYFGLGVLAWSPLAGGVLSGKYTRGGDRDTQREMFVRGSGKLDERALSIARAVDAVADDIGKSSSEVALAWMRSRKGQIIPILGARKLGQLEETLGCLDVTLAPEALAKLDEASRIALGFPHDFLSTPFVTKLVYGPTGPQLEVTRP
jgi:aryl-alcohol dehydrogenase-like predicted oxidoreductase